MYWALYWVPSIYSAVFKKKKLEQELGAKIKAYRCYVSTNIIMLF